MNNDATGPYFHGSFQSLFRTFCSWSIKTPTVITGIVSKIVADRLSRWEDKLYVSQSAYVAIRFVPTMLSKL
jgi:hypothetical protein